MNVGELVEMLEVYGSHVEVAVVVANDSHHETYYPKMTVDYSIAANKVLIEVGDDSEMA